MWVSDGKQSAIMWYHRQTDWLEKAVSRDPLIYIIMYDIPTKRLIL